MEINPNEADISGPTVNDNTAPEGLSFHYAEGAKQLATPWQVSIERAKLVRKCNIHPGKIVDPACGSGIQLAAYCAILGRQGLGIELDEETAKSAAANFRRIAEQGFDSSLLESTIRIGDGTTTDDKEKFSMLHVDPARPRNSRSHSLEEMQPQLPAIFENWKEKLIHDERGPAILLDLSPRLSDKQRLEVESIVEDFWPNIGHTWTWTSRGKGRIDRLSLWIGQLSKPSISRRFIRIPPDMKATPLIIEGNKSSNIEQNRLPRKGDYVTILDSALVESGLADEWLSQILCNQELTWMVVNGRRPQISHQSAIPLSNKEEKILIQASGRVVKLVHTELTEETISTIIAAAREYGFGKLTLRVPLPPEQHPSLQGSIDRQLSARGGPYTGFIVKQPGDSMLLLCVDSS
ncbi:MAG: hypothetical protein QGI21_05385 [Candidatus Poseidoniaceae archaeon]|jgi:hypothetical protein|nr:hypothetical protein [Candidatus Poseidoniaceae archaeon]